MEYGEMIAKPKRTAIADHPEADPVPSAAELCLTFLRHAESLFAKIGESTSEIIVLKSKIHHDGFYESFEVLSLVLIGVAISTLSGV